MNKISVIVPVILIVIIAGFLIFATQQSTPSEEEAMTEKEDGGAIMDKEEPVMKKELVIGLLEQNDSGESGIATLTEIEGQTRVFIETVGTTADIPQPVHIHEGSCAELGGVNYPLTNVINGASETTVDVLFEQLTKELPLAINIHRSGPEIDVYVACGDFPTDLMMEITDGDGMTMEQGEESVTVALSAQNDSGESGTATITSVDQDVGPNAIPLGKTQIILDLNGTPEEIVQPAHIHIGSCADLGGVKYPLSNVLNGSSETIIDIPLDQLLSELPLAVNVHKSPEEIAVYVACGDITQ